jgi:predicted nucleic acid-binding protein
MKALLDVNVILDVLLKRGDWLADADAIWSASAEGKLECGVAASSLTDIYYIARRLSGRAQARDAVAACLESLTVFAVDRQVIEHAQGFASTDFEDAVQIAVAAANAVDAIVTRDATGFAAASVRVLAPAELVQDLAQKAEVDA